MSIGHRIPALAHGPERKSGVGSPTRRKPHSSGAFHQISHAMIASVTYLPAPTFKTIDNWPEQSRERAAMLAGRTGEYGVRSTAQCSLYLRERLVARCGAVSCGRVGTHSYGTQMAGCGGS